MPRRVVRRKCTPNIGFGRRDSCLVGAESWRQPARPCVVQGPLGILRGALLGAWPNPFRRTPGVVFERSGTGRVELELYEPVGRRMRSIVEDNLATGRNVRLLGGVGLASVLCMRCLESQGLLKTQRVVLLRE